MQKRASLKHFDWTNLIFLLVALIVVFLVCVPIGFMIYKSLTTQGGVFTLENFVKYLGKRSVQTAILNTVIVAVGIGILATLIGVTLAFGVSRTNMRGKALVKTTIIIAIMTPPFLVTLAYIMLAGPNSGYINRLLRAVFRLDTVYGPINIYSVWALVVLGAPQSIATIFMMTFPALENMDPSLEESARVTGANALRTSLRITIPLVRPAILSGFMLSFGQSVAMYGVPRMLNIEVLTTAIRESMTMMDFQMGAVLSVVVTCFSLLAVLLYRTAVRSGKKYQTISAKGFRPSVLKLKSSRHLFTALGLVYAFLAFLLPYGTLMLTSFMKSPGNGIVPSNLTLDNYAALMRNSNTVTAFKNSFLLAFMTATAVVVIGLLCSYLIVRMKVKGSAVLEYLYNMPSGIAGTALAMGLIFMYLTRPLSSLRIYGTIWILLVAYVTRMLPSGTRYCQSALLQVSYELEEASRVSGASWRGTLVKVTLPLVKTGVVYAWILTFIMAFPELSASVMLRNPKTDVVSTAILNLWDGSGGLPQAAAFGMVVFGLITLLVVFGQKLTGKSMLDRAS